MATKLLLSLGLSALLAGCASISVQRAPNPEHVSRNSTDGRKLFVFLDGTSNDWKARTNVRRLFELVAAQEDPSRLCLWVEGVGTHGVLGKGLGLGMEPRIMAGYEFLTRNYRPGDEIYIFGFSRGAFEARQLCGVLAHCGLYQPRVADNKLAEGQAKRLPLHRIWNECSRLEEESGKEIDIVTRLKLNRARIAQRVGGTFVDAPVKFLGIWDTVPGLQLTKYNAESDEIHGREDVQHPLYKVRPYPNIKRIVHALSIDEVRSQFAPLLVGPPLVPSATTVFEVWFPGAHSDIGGGYSDSNEMAGVSLDWMLSLLKGDALIGGTSYRVNSNPLGIVHHPELDFWGSFGSKVNQRIIPAGAMVHTSVVERARSKIKLWECLDVDKGTYVDIPYRPDPGVRTITAGETITEHPFTDKPLVDGKPTPDRAQWKFNEGKFEDYYEVVDTDATAPLRGPALTLAKAQVETVVVPAPANPAAGIVRKITHLP